MKPRVTSRDLLLLAALTLLTILVHGYHLGIEDQAIYLPAIKKNLNPALYPTDAEFFLSQTDLTAVDELVARSVLWFHLPLDWAVFLWNTLGIFLFLLACWQISQRLFAETSARWASVGLVAALFTMPVAGTLVLIVAECLHPRSLATPAILFALLGMMDRRATALLWLAIAAVLHPLMALIGICHLAFQIRLPRAPHVTSFLAVPLLATAAHPAYREIFLSRRHYFPLRWTWYELLGALAPMILLLWFSRIGRRHGMPALEHVSGRLALSGSLGVASAFGISMIPGLEGLVKTEPLRSLHLVYILMFLLMGGLLGKWVLKDRPVRWLLLFVPLAAGMCFAQFQVYPASAHIEWPGAAPKNEWVQAFDWVRLNTPADAVFALDPRYMKRPGADAHGFRALAERSRMADDVKDRGVAAIFPALAERWRREIDARRRWQDFQLEDFQRLKRQYGVTWTVVERPGVAGLNCPYANARVMVCRIE